MSDINTFECLTHLGNHNILKGKSFTKLVNHPCFPIFHVAFPQICQALKLYNRQSNNPQMGHDQKLLSPKYVKHSNTI